MDLVRDGASRSQSIVDVDLKAAQIFNNNIEKIVVPFDREEDMMLLCLSVFLHDFIHDYNLGSSMQKRVFNGIVNVVDETGSRIKIRTVDLLVKLNLGIKHPIIKNVVYRLSSGYGDNKMYDDNTFVDAETLQSVDGKPSAADLKSYVEQFETLVVGQGRQLGGHGERGNDRFYRSNYRVKQPFSLPFKRQSVKNRKIVRNQSKKKRHSLDDSDVNPYNFTVEPEKGSESTNLKFSGDEETLLDTATYHFENNLDFLEFYSRLNTLIVTYLGSGDDTIVSDDFNDLYKSAKEPMTREMLNNAAIFNSILCSIEYIINDLSKTDNITDENEVVRCSFVVLKSAFISVYRNNEDGFKNSPLMVLNSLEMLRKYIKFYIIFINSEDNSEFYSRLEKKGGVKQRNYTQTPLGTFSEIGTQPGSPPSLETQQEEELSEFLEVKQDIVPVTETIIRPHNNLITTLARGMFVKLGIWNKLFPKQTDEPEGQEMVFSKDQIGLITYNKLLTIFPTDPISGGHINNELLIMEILILKHMLLEMPPVNAISFGDGIDDPMKDYLDIFYNKHYLNKQTVYEPQVYIDPEVLENPDSFNDDYSDDEDAEQKEALFRGGKKGENGEIEMTKIEKAEREQYIEAEQPILEQGDSHDELSTFVPPLENIHPSIKTETIRIVNPEALHSMPRAPAMPILLKNLKRMYQSNVFTIQNLKLSKIPTIVINGKEVNNLYDLLSYNKILIKKVGSTYKIHAPYMKFVINNAATISANMNGARYIYSNSDKEDVSKLISYLETTIANNAVSAEKNVIESEINIRLRKIKDLKDEEARINSLKQKDKPLPLVNANRLVMLNYDIKVINNSQMIPLKNKLYLLTTYSNLNSENPEKASEWLNDWKDNHMVWLNECQAFFGLYRNLSRGVFCPTVSMMDAMPNCSLKYGATEPKEVGTMNFELKYESRDGEPKRIISYGGTVLNYRETINGRRQLSAKIDFDLVCVDERNDVNDTANISTIGIEVAESYDLKASVVYKRVVDKINEIYIRTCRDNPHSDEVITDDAKMNIKQLKDRITNMWSNVQYYVNKENFNDLLGATCIKTFGDYLQECLACVQWGGYVNSQNQFSPSLKSFIGDKDITPIYRSVSDFNKIIPYDDNGNAIRIGIQGDRPSGFRSMYILLNGRTGINQHAITGYIKTSPTQTQSRTILVSRNSSEYSNVNLNRNDFGLDINGKLIYVTREPRVLPKQNIDFLKSLETKRITTKNIGALPDLVDLSIKGSVTSTVKKLTKKQRDALNVEKGERILTPYYDDWVDYETEPVISYVKESASIEEPSAIEEIGGIVEEPAKEVERELGGGKLKRTHYKRLKQNKKTKRKRV